MRTLLALAALPLIAASPQAAPMPEWMVGSWCTEAGDERTCERWGPPAGDVMLGTSQTVKGGRTVSFEFLRIVAGETGPSYVAQPGGGAAVTFRAVAHGDRSITFANPDHDYPQRIRYWRDGEALVAEISLSDGGKAMRWRFAAVE